MAVLLQKVTLSGRLEAKSITGGVVVTIFIISESTEQPAALYVLTVTCCPVFKRLLVYVETADLAPAEAPPMKNSYSTAPVPEP